MRPTRFVGLASALLLVTGCDMTPSEPTDLSAITAAAPGNGNGGGPPGGGDGAVFTATLRDLSTDGIRSDGGATYTDGVDDVAVTINSDGQFFLLTRESTVRALHIRVEDTGGAALFDGLAHANLQTRNVSNEGGVDLRALAVGESSAVPVRVRWFDSGVQYTLRFGRACFDNVVVAVEMGLVTRTSSTTWTVGNGSTGRLCIKDTQGTNKPKDDTTTQVLGVTAAFEVRLEEQ